MLTSDLHHAVFGLHHQLLRGEVVDIQGHLPAVLGLLDLRHARAHLAGQGTSLMGPQQGGRVHHGGVGHHGAHGAHVRRHHGVPQVPWPVGAWECGEILVQRWHAEGLIEDAALLPVAERVPARGAEEGERNMSLGHGCCRLERSVAVTESCWL